MPVLSVYFHDQWTVWTATCSFPIISCSFKFGKICSLLYDVGNLIHQCIFGGEKMKALYFCSFTACRMCVCVCVFGLWHKCCDLTSVTSYWMTLAPCRSTKCPYAFTELSFQFVYGARREEKSEAGTIKSVCFSVGLVLNHVQVQAGLVYGNTLLWGIKACVGIAERYKQH